MLETGELQEYENEAELLFPERLRESDNPATQVVVSVGEAFVESFVEYSPDAPVKDYVNQQTWVPGVIVSNNEEISPFDCERWPNSPFCDGSQVVDAEIGSVFNPRINIPLLDIDIQKVQASSCEICVPVQTRIFGVPGPLTFVCTRNDSPECQPEINDIPEQPETFDDISLAQIGAIRVPDYIRVVVTVNFISEVSYLWQTGVNNLSNNDGSRAAFQDLYDDFRKGKVQAVPGVFFEPPSVGLFHQSPRWSPDTTAWDKTGRISGIFWQHFKHINADYQDSEEMDFTYGGEVKTRYVERTKRQLDSFAMFADYRCVSFSISSAKENLIRRATSSFDANWYSQYVGVFEDSNPFSNGKDFYRPNDFFTTVSPGFYTSRQGCGIRKSVPIQPKPESDDMGCCSETLELLEAIYLRLGVDEYPSIVPETLQGNSEKTIAIENLTQFVGWLTQAYDGNEGQWPVEIKIKDTDPTKEGNQSETITLPNSAEAIAEMFALNYQSELKIDILTEVLFRLVPEVIAAKNASIIGQGWSKANGEYLGYKMNMKPKKYPVQFNMNEPQRLEQFLEDRNEPLLIPVNEERRTLSDVVEQLLFAAAIIKESHFVPDSRRGQLLETIEDMIRDQTLTAPNREKWNEWIQRMNRDISRHNKDQSVKPEIVPDVHENIEVKDGEDGPQISF
ncbi:MAG: hypothetical protein AAF609_08550 [Cyanobacteria bacterium P01_C01_bin.120]